MVACNATPARHLWHVNYITPFPRNVSLDSLCLCREGKPFTVHPIACVAAGPRTRLNCTEGLERLRRRQ